MAVVGNDLAALDDGANQVLRHAIAELAVVGDVEQQQVGLFADFEAADACALPDGVRDAEEWYATDALDSVRLTLDNNGAVLGGATYDPWGSIESGSIDTFGFTGELQRGDQVYLRARWYNAGYGTFMSRDPFAGYDEQPYSLHPYQYAYSNPILLTDPSGRCLGTLEDPEKSDWECWSLYKQINKSFYPEVTGFADWEAEHLRWLKRWLDTGIKFVRLSGADWTAENVEDVITSLDRIKAALGGKIDEALGLDSITFLKAEAAPNMGGLQDFTTIKLFLPNTPTYNREQARDITTHELGHLLDQRAGLRQGKGGYWSYSDPWMKELTWCLIGNVYSITDNNLKESAFRDYSLLDPREDFTDTFSLYIEKNYGDGDYTPATLERKIVNWKGDVSIVRRDLLQKFLANL